MQRPSHHDIAVRAFHLWEEAGRLDNLSLHYWLIAEFELAHDWHKLPRHKHTRRFFLT